MMNRPKTGTWLDHTDRDTFDAREVASAEGKSSRTIIRLIKDPGRPFGDTVYRVGRSYRIPWEAVHHFHQWARVHQS